MSIVGSQLSSAAVEWTAVETPAKPKVKREKRSKINPLEAYRLGRMVSGRQNGVYLSTDGQSCAIGAIAIGMGYITPESDSGEAYNAAQKVLEQMGNIHVPIKCKHRPDWFDGNSVGLGHVIEHYSDDHSKDRGTEKKLIKLLEKHYAI